MSTTCHGSLLIAAAVMMAGCRTLPRDPFLRAEQAMQRRDLAMALSAYDAVPVAHPRYPEARAAAAAVEQSMRHGHELLLEALQLRAQWRDDEALIALAGAGSVWPGMHGLEALVAATAQRQRLFAADPAAPPPAPPAPPAAPAAEVVVVQPAPAPTESTLAPVAAPAPTEATPTTPPAIELPVVSAPLPPVVESALPAAVSPPMMALPVVEPALPSALPTAAPVTAAALPAQPADDPVSRALVAIELRLARRDVEPAVLELLELERRHPDDLRIRPRLARLLHQRALLRYGSGSVELAIRDWERVLRLDPRHVDARSFMRAAISEQERHR